MNKGYRTGFSGERKTKDRAEALSFTCELRIYARYDASFGSRLQHVTT